MKSIDLNADLGESFGPWQMGDDSAMLQIVSSANIACGGHAGDNDVMDKTVSEALSQGVVIGAHPGFEDKQGFGRRRLPLTMAEVERLVAAQVGALCGIAALHQAPVRYVKAHGALSNWASEDREAARAIVRAIAAVQGSEAAILAVSGTELEIAGKEQGIACYSEIFADRGYTPQGNLVPRGQEGAMIHDAETAAARLIGFFESGLMPTVGGDPVRLEAHSICIHGDGPGAVAIARELRRRLEEAGLAIKPFWQAADA
ncbi:LamB/YcsF family protein [Rhodovibrionaceae bacterium A322]